MQVNVFFSKYKQDKGHVKKRKPDMVNVLGGKLMYLKMVKGAEDSVYERLQTRFDELTRALKDAHNTTVQGITYVETIPLLEFEKNNHTEVVITTFKPLEEVNAEDENKVITHRYAYFTLGGHKELASVNKSLRPEEENDKSLLSISSCRDAKGKPFWLIHRSGKVVVPPLSPINIDELNNDLDTLLSI